MDTLKKIGKQFKIARVSQGLTLEELADRSGVSYGTVGAIERGAYDVSLTKLDQVSRALDSSLEINLTTNKDNLIIARA